MPDKARRKHLRIILLKIHALKPGWNSALYNDFTKILLFANQQRSESISITSLLFPSFSNSFLKIDLLTFVIVAGDTPNKLLTLKAFTCRRKSKHA